MSAGYGFSHPAILLRLLALPLYAWLRARALHRDAVPHAPLQYRAGPANRTRWARLGCSSSCCSSPSW